MEYPQYRRLSNGKSMYEIIDDRHFNEKQRVGSKIYTYSFVEEQYPEIVKIKDMIECYEDLYEIVYEKDWLIFG